MCLSTCPVLGNQMGVSAKQAARPDPLFVIAQHSLREWDDRSDLPPMGIFTGSVETLP